MDAGLFKTPPISRQRWWLLTLVAFFLLLSIQYSFKAGDGTRSAFVRWRPQIQQLPGANIWALSNFPNPPIMAIILKPLADLPHALAGALCWYYLKVGMTLIAFSWVFGLVAAPDRPFPFGGKVLAVLLSLRPIMGDLYHGNVNLFIMFLVIAALYAFCRGRDVATGILLALAIACKVTPALFVPYFLWKRAWKTLAGCVAGLVLFLAVVPSCYLGVERNNEDFASWWKNMVTPFVVGGRVTTDLSNQSLPGVLFRLGSASPSIYDGAGNPAQWDNIESFRPKDLAWAVKGCMAAFAVLVVWTCRTPTAPRRGWRLAAEFSLVVLGMLLFSERTWKHHCVTLVLPFAVLSYYLTACRPGKFLRSYLIVSLAAVMLLMASTSTTILDWQESAAKMAQVYGAYVWANLILVAALIVILRRKETQPVPSFVSAGEPPAPVNSLMVGV